MRKERFLDWMWAILTGLLVTVMILAANIVVEVWGQTKTVLYKDYQQTISVSHFFSPDSIGPPFTVTGNGVGQIAGGLAPDMVGNSSVAGLSSAAVVAKIRRLTDGGAVGALAVSDGTNWNCDVGKSLKVRVVTCPPYNAKGDGVTDDKAAIEAALADNSTVEIPGPATYLISGAINLDKNNMVLRGGQGATLKLQNNKNTDVLSIAAGTVNVTIEGFIIDGNEANQPACAEGCRGVMVNSGTFDVKIRNNTLRNINNNGIRLAGVTRSWVENNYIANISGEGTQGSGINYSATTNRWAVIEGNVIQDMAGSGIGFNGKDAEIHYNLVYNSAQTIAQQGIVLGYGIAGSNTDAERVNASGNQVHTTSLHGCYRMGGSDLTISDSLAQDCGERGIIALTTNDGVTRGKNLRILRNTIKTPSVSNAINEGIEITRCDGCDAEGNTVEMAPTATANAVVLSSVDGGKWNNNRIKYGNVGMRIGESQNFVATGNQITASVVSGILLSGATSTAGLITGNNVTNLGIGASSGISTSANSPDQITVTNNNVVNAGGAGAVITSSAPNSFTKGNYAPGLLCSSGSASTLIVTGTRANCDVLFVQQNAGNITGLELVPVGRVIVLSFLDGVTLVDNDSTLELAGNFGAGVGQTITLASTGTGWQEVTRSLN